MQKSGKTVFILIVFLSLVLLISEGRAEQETEAPEKLAIGSIQTVGNVSISSTQILSKVRSRVGDLFEEERAVRPLLITKSN